MVDHVAVMHSRNQVIVTKGVEAAGLMTAAVVTNPGCPKFPSLRAFNRSLGRIWQVKVREGGGISAATPVAITTAQFAPRLR